MGILFASLMGILMRILIGSLMGILMGILIEILMSILMSILIEWPYDSFDCLLYKLEGGALLIKDPPQTITTTCQKNMRDVT